jgi:hypothetical protein
MLNYQRVLMTIPVTCLNEPHRCGVAGTARCFGVALAVAEHERSLGGTAADLALELPMVPAVNPPVLEDFCLAFTKKRWELSMEVL